MIRLFRRATFSCLCCWRLLCHRAAVLVNISAVFPGRGFHPRARGWLVCHTFLSSKTGEIVHWPLQDRYPTRPAQTSTTTHYNVRTA